MNVKYRNHLILLLLIATIILVAGLGLRDPWPADEPRFALIAKGMVDGGNWLFPRVGGVLYPDKPPLFFWFVASLYALFGSIKVAILLPGVIAGVIVLFLVTDLAKRLWGPQVAITCGATLLAMIQFPLQMKSGQIDGFLCLWTTLGLYGFCRHLLLGPEWRWYAVGGLACGLGVITKGVGFLPFLLLIPYAFAARRSWPVLRVQRWDWRWLLAPVTFFLAIELWLVPMLVVTTTSGDPELIIYRDNILLTQTITRYAESWGHLHPPWYLITNAATWLWFPVTVLLPWLVPAWRRDIRNGNAAVLLIGTWIILLLLFFSLSSGKRSLYIFPAAPALALIAGYHISGLLRRAGPQRVIAASTAMLGLLLLGGAIYLVNHPSFASHWVIDGELEAAMPLRLFGMAALVLLAVLATRMRHAAFGYAAGLTVIWLGLSVLVYPAIDDVRSGRALMSAVDERVDDSTALAFVGWPEQFLLQWDKRVAHFGYRRENGEEARDAVDWLLGGEDRRLLLSGSMLSPCFAESGLELVGLAHRRNWYLAEQSDVATACTNLPGPARDMVAYHSRSAGVFQNRQMTPNAGSTGSQ